MTSTFTVSAMGDDRLVIDLRSPEPSYQQLARQLRDRIHGGIYAPGGPLPSITYLTGETGLAVNTVRRAIALLADEGYVVTVPGRGTYVAGKLPE
jgi:DNA-binding GntR family transcriptional regulator